jgi:hypothetical protein
MAFTNDGSFFEQFQRMQQQQQQASESSPPAEAVASTSAEKPSPPIIERGQQFAAAATFSTEQPGYFFGTGRGFNIQKGPSSCLQGLGICKSSLLLAWVHFCL